MPHHLDVVPTDASMHVAAARDGVRENGVHVVRKRVMQLLSSRQRSHGMPWNHVLPAPDRYDECRTVSALLQCTTAQLQAALSASTVHAQRNRRISDFPDVLKGLRRPE